MSRSITSLAFVVLLLGVTARADAQSTSVAAPAATPTTTPAIGVYLDTAALRAALAALPPHADARRGARILTIGFDSTGRPLTPRRAVGAMMPDATRDTLVALVRALVKPAEPRARAWETHLLLETGPEARVEEVVLDRREASVADRPMLTRRLERAATELMAADDSLAGHELRVRLRIALSLEGLVEEISVLGSSGNAKVDSAAITLVKPTRFVPAFVEGEAVRAVVVLPVRFIFEP